MVKGKQFSNFRDTGDPVSAARIYNAQTVDELLFIDIDAYNEGRAALFEVIEKVSSELFIPFCVGGGIKDIDTIKELLRAGADKVSICTAAVDDVGFIREAIQTFGSQCIVICVDYRFEGGVYTVYTHSGSVKTNKVFEQYIMELTELNVGEILLNSIDRDGMMNGFDIDILKKTRAMTNIPIIALGGAGKLTDFAAAFSEANISAVSAASIFHFSDQSPIKVNFFLKSAGVFVR